MQEGNKRCCLCSSQPYVGIIWWGDEEKLKRVHLQENWEKLGLRGFHEGISFFQRFSYASKSFLFFFLSLKDRMSCSPGWTWAPYFLYFLGEGIMTYAIIPGLTLLAIKPVFSVSWFSSLLAVLQGFLLSMYNCIFIVSVGNCPTEMCCVFAYDTSWSEE